MTKTVSFSAEYESRRAELVKESSKSIPSPTYNAISERVRLYGCIDHSSITKELIQKLYVNEQRTDAEIAKLFGLTSSGMESKRRRLGIQDNQTTFNKVLKCSQAALNELGQRAFKL